jgi:hypothetical protein
MRSVFFDGLWDDKVEALFQIDRAAEYEQIAEEARRLSETPRPEGSRSTITAAHKTRLILFG